MITNGNSPHVSWELKVNVFEFDIIEHSLRVTGDMHIGGVIFQLVEQLGQIRNDWSDFALWWPDKNMWLSKNKLTLDQYGVQADANLFFTRMHKPLRVQLPDQQCLEVNADFSINVFNAVKQICKELGVRHHEEVFFSILF
jgi:kindlin 2